MRWNGGIRFAFLAALALRPVFALDPAEILILVNKDTPVSGEVARMYQRLRAIPADNVLRLSLGAKRELTREQYRKDLIPPVKKYLTDHTAIRCIVTTSGVPYLILNSEGKQDGAAFDNELAAVLRDEPADLNRWQPNPLYYHGQNVFGIDNPRMFQAVYVTRLDGPDLKTITRMVEDAVTVESDGLEGPVFGDAQGIDGNRGSAIGDLSIRGAIDRLSGAGFPATLDLNQADWKQPPGGVGEQAAGAAFYIGWYNLQNFQDIFGKQGLARGAIAWHIASNEAQNLWDTNSREWCINLMRRGAAVTLGPAFEPYLEAFPKAEIFVEALLSGRTIAESYWLSLPHVSWAMVIVGDPLYRPFAKPRPSLVARSYVASNASRVLGRGETAALLVQIQCVGPQGTSTPAFTTAVEPGMGLAGASGNVPIPALQAGQSAVVRIPSVKASDDPTGMFRLHLNVRNEGDTSRRIVLEGRNGIATISGGLQRQTMMVPSPAGDVIIAGRPGDTLLVDTATLRARRVGVPEGWGVVGAAFAPDGGHFVLTLLNPDKKQTGSAIVDSTLQKMQGTPPETAVLRWLTKDTLLLKTKSGLAVYDLNTATSIPVFEPEGWTVNSIIPDTSVQLLTGKDGRFGIKVGGAEPREILAGTGATRDRAVANDLSLFGGLDDKKQLWIQRGVDATPAVVAKDVKAVAWGPISRRVLVEGNDGSSRVFDGRDNSWTPLPPIVSAEWSPDESRMIFVEAEKRDGQIVPQYLSLWDGRQTMRLIDVNRLGELGGALLSKAGDMAFLLSGPDGARQILAVPLPPPVPRQ